MSNDLTKIGILGSRRLASKILRYICSVKRGVIVGIVPPPFEGWWKDDFEVTARELNIPVLTYGELFEKMPDIIFSINYWKKIQGNDIKRIPLGIVNIHHSYLLKYRGRYSTSYAILNARRLNCWEHGSTLHYINEKLDDGGIIDSEKCKILETDTAETLFEKVEAIAFNLFTKNYDRMIRSKITEYLEADENTFFYGKDSNKDLEVKYGMPINEFCDFVRAWTFKDRPKPYIQCGEGKIELTYKIRE